MRLMCNRLNDTNLAKGQSFIQIHAIACDDVDAFQIASFIWRIKKSPPNIFLLRIDRVIKVSKPITHIRNGNSPSSDITSFMIKMM